MLSQIPNCGRYTECKGLVWGIKDKLMIRDHERTKRGPWTTYPAIGDGPKVILDQLGSKNK